MNGQSIGEILATEARISGRIIQETIGGIRRTGWMNVVIVITMASILSIFATILVSVLDVQLFMENVGSTLKLSVYLDDKTDVNETNAMILKMQLVRDTELVPKDQAWNDLKKVYDIPDIQNPLPNTIHVSVKSQAYMDKAYELLKDLPGVLKVNYPQQVLRRIQQVSQVTSAVGFAISLYLGVLTMFIISNTIHLLIQARSREIEILRMMGVGNWYIRLPFIFQGAFYGLAGALIAYIPLYFAEFYITQLFQYFQFSTSGYSSTMVTITMCLMGLLVGAGGSTFSIHKYLKI